MAGNYGVAKEWCQDRSHEATKPMITKCIRVMNNNISVPGNAPKDFFDENSFKTLTGAVLVTWLTTNAIAYTWGVVDPKMLGLVIAFAVVLIGFVMSEKRTLKKLLLTPFNAVLVYMTIIGATSFLPAPVPYETGVNGTGTTISQAGPDQQESGTRARFFRSWNPDQQLADAASQIRDEHLKVRQTVERLEVENTVLDAELTKYQNLTRRYESRLDSTRRVLERMSLSPQQEQTVLPLLQMEAPHLVMPN